MIGDTPAISGRLTPGQETKLDVGVSWGTGAANEWSLVVQPDATGSFMDLKAMSAQLLISYALYLTN